MLPLLRRRRASRPAPVHTRRLHLESLERRENPTTPPYAPGYEPVPVQPAPNAIPTIRDFQAISMGNGIYVLSGTVEDENPAGLVVTLGGSTSCAGQTTTTNQYGYFAFQVTLRTDGSDTGLITATCVDSQGQVSNVASWWVTPQG